MHLLPAYRHLSETQEEMIWELGTLNLGPVKAFNIMRKRYGGFENVGATKDDCKNFRARIHSYIGQYDADMVINRYKMVFVPFTGIDNHCRNVTLGAGLLASESIESYKWLLQSFLNSFDSITPEMSERDWKLIMIDFGLTENKWIDDMFGMRSSWIPAFYRHEPMSGLMRTTSRSESENHFFCQVANSQLTLVEFFNHFDGAMDIQRFNHRKNDHISRNTIPDKFSESTLEDDAMKIYTRSIFADQPEELQGTLSECLPMETKIEEPFLKISMKDWKDHGDGLLEVCFKKGEDVIALCTCRRFEQYGLLCKHIYFVFKMFKVKEIPNKYVMRRWTKDVVPNDLNNTFDITVDDDDAHKKAKEVAYEIMQIGEYIIGNLIKDFDHLLIVRDRMREMKEMVDELRITKPIDPKFDRYSRLIGYEKPNTDDPPTVRVPTGIRNKGRGSHKRIKSKKEKIISLKGKRGRTCSHCNIKGHDIRTCKLLKGEATAADKDANKEGRKRRAIQLEKDPNLVDEEDEEVEIGDEEEYEESDEAEDSDFECEDE
ncbi:uncharacterized protein LOC110870393 [Helianthus annuus]|uniref:uncharacterized protein LOC110870393 n=1 Tax=Helianthus annuus TaxID=4232 RepID=UPI000B906682|nr:uncharacterized protein LOC110870393 [Helianthus annuus]